MSDPSRRARRNLGVVTVMGLLALSVLTHWPGLGLGPSSDPGPDKTVHMLAFALVTGGAWFSGWFRSLTSLWIAAALWAAIDEWTQALPPFNRLRDVEDWAADLLGATLAVAWIVASRPLGGWETRRRRAARESAFGELFSRWWPWPLVALGAIAGAAGSLPIFLWIGERSWAMPSRQVVMTGLMVVSIAAALGTTEILLRLTTLKPQPLLPDRTMARLCAGPALAAFAMLILVMVAAQLVLVLRPLFRPAAMLDDWYRTRSMTLRSAIDLALIVLLAAWACHRARRNVARRIDAAHLRCVRCDQDLTGLETRDGRGTCPECGTVYECPPVT